MDANLIEAIAKLWPLALTITLLILGLVFRNAIKTILEKRSLKVKRGDTEISLEGQVAALEDEPGAMIEPADEAEVAVDIQPLLPVIDAEVGEEKTVEDLNTEMFRAFTSGDVEEGTAIYNQLQEAEQDETERLRHKAFFLYLKHQKGDATALNELKVLTQNEDVQSSAYAWIAICYSSAGDYENAAAAYKSAADTADNLGLSASHRVSQAQAVQTTGEDSEALIILSRAIAEAEDDASLAILYRGVGRLYGSMDDQEMRALALESALQLRPNDINLRFNTAYAYSQVGYEQLSMFHYETLLQFAPDNETSRNNLGVAYDELGLKIRSTRAYRRASENDQTLASANLAYKYMGQGFADEASSILKAARAKDEVHANVGSAISDLAQREEQENKKRDEIVEGSRKLRRFFLSFSSAMISHQGQSASVEGTWTSETPTEFTVTQSQTKFTMSWEIENQKHRIVGDIANLGTRAAKQMMKYSLLNREEMGFEDSGKAFGYLDERSETWHLLIVEKSEFEYIGLARGT